MPRNKAFVPSHEPLRAHDSLQIQPEHISGPFFFLNPTRAHYRHNALASQGAERPAKIVQSTAGASALDEEKPCPAQDEQPASGIHFKWRSRDNRKGRHALVLDPQCNSSNAEYIVPRRTSSLRAVGLGIKRMATQYPYWNISYLVATIFTLGSVIWVINAFFSYLPLAQPQTEFRTEILYGGGITAFIGATVFEVGSVLLMFEAVNENRAGCFGWALEKVIESGIGRVRLKPDDGVCAHHHTNKKNLVGNADVKTPSSTTLLRTPSSSHSSQISHPEKPSSSATTTPASGPPSSKSWQWFPSTHDLTTHYLREIGFLASLAQFLGATVFWISGFTALPGINNKLSQGLLDGIFWTPQIVGGTGFIVSGFLFMLETQPKWYMPAPRVLGWHIGLWNLVGAFGFTLCGALGPAYRNSGAEYQAALATFWGSWAFLLGSLVQWYECLDRHPVEEEEGKGTEAEGGS